MTQRPLKKARATQYTTLLGRATSAAYFPVSERAEKIDETLNELAPTAEIHFLRVAVTPEQIVELALPTRPTKATDSRSKSWGGGDESVELDGIEPDHTAHNGERGYRTASPFGRA